MRHAPLLHSREGDRWQISGSDRSRSHFGRRGRTGYGSGSKCSTSTATPNAKGLCEQGGAGTGEGLSYISVAVHSAIFRPISRLGAIAWVHALGPIGRAPLGIVLRDRPETLKAARRMLGRNCESVGPQIPAARVHKGP